MDSSSNSFPPTHSESRPVVIYTDGGCRGNPGPGGWGAFLSYNGTEKELWGGEALTTNNRMELMAAIQALEALKKDCSIELHTDSQYLRNGITQWIGSWKANGWRTSQKKPVKNADLWQRLDVARQRHSISWLWVRGHDGDPGNERAHILAQRGITDGDTTPQNAS